MSVLKIKRFLSESSKPNQINIKAMFTHSAAFGLYVFSIVIVAVTNAIYMANFDKQWARITIDLSLSIMYVISFLSQCLLCLIFKQLSTKDPFSGQTF